jgi:CheY-like chemotaxis protein
MLILIVDDEACLCELMAEILVEHFVVITASNGKEALALVQKYKPDVIISDVMMPLMSGLELLKALRADPMSRHIPVILLSAAVSGLNIPEANAFIQKPFNIENLERVVTEIIKTKGNEFRVKFE